MPVWENVRSNRTFMELKFYFSTNGVPLHQF